jgi:chloride channel protein, CIC family
MNVLTPSDERVYLFKQCFERVCFFWMALPPDIVPQQVHSEIEEYTEVRQQRRQLLPRAALVGLVAGLVASLFRLALAGADVLRNGLIQWARHLPWGGWVFPLVFGITGAVASLALVRRFAPEAKGSGIPHLKAVQYRFRQMSWRRILPVKFIAGVLAIGSGMVLGREGPTVQMGGAVGDAVADWLKVAPRERRTLIAAGAGAGLAAAFNAPLSGLTFVLEEVQRDFHPVVFAATFIACVISDIVARALTGSLPVFTIPAYPALPLGALPYLPYWG